MTKYGLGWTDSMINDPGFCARSGLGLGGWFDRGPEPTYQRSPSELRLREDGHGAFVVSAFIWWSSEKPPANQAVRGRRPSPARSVSQVRLPGRAAVLPAMSVGLLA